MTVSPANEAGQRRADLARRLAQSCPPALADEIALVGSTARGLADGDSDLELNLWAEAIPPLDARLEWLRASGASEIETEKMPRPDDSYWIKFRLGDIPAEVGWQTFDKLKVQLDLILSGTATDRQTLAFADILTSAIPLRTTGRLQAWQHRLMNYPDALQRRMIMEAVENWSRSSDFALKRKLARRGERLVLTLNLLDELDQVMRLLYAIHRRWQPSSKWTLTVAREFAPFDLNARIDAVLGDPSLERRVDLCARLCLDVLALVPEGYDISAAVDALKAEK